ncbi:MAG: hypothetical protein AB8G96_12550 [Phycisphaerales bacterium]
MRQWTIRMGLPGGRRNPAPRRGIALIEAMLGGLLLGIGMAVIMSLASRSMRVQVQGENRMTAGWLADDLLNMVVAHGPEVYRKEFETEGEFDGPYAGFNYEVSFDEVGRGVPWRVSALVWWGDRPNERVLVETLIAARLNEDEDPVREPEEELDRDARWFGEDEETG